MTSLSSPLGDDDQAWGGGGVRSPFHNSNSYEGEFSFNNLGVDENDISGAANNLKRPNYIQPETFIDTSMDPKLFTPIAGKVIQTANGGPNSAIGEQGYGNEIIDEVPVK